MGIDVMSAGVALAWATEASEKGIISDKETVAALNFGDAAGYKEAIFILQPGPTIFTGCWGRAP